ncbi:hypothetical protein E4P41_00470 [Geodermatophilus sp. DF01-2]|uniref:UGSC family (seleno)protein n=1 Tax=Geodermatophilus sp. DF01-2 TaxID=2559610 RepID=UPI0010743B14|nr:hypothetical protein [Geodermatophilus sp. DF01_2]TFV64749.1 hypothetical protein E4P41_00470 [Geodermatophilus sp. DF01_2]
MVVRIVDPSGSEPPTQRLDTTPRPASLAGARIAVLNNGKPNAEHVVRRLAGHLAERFGTQEPEGAEKPNSSRPFEAEVLDRFRNFDAAVVGVGD